MRRTSTALLVAALLGGLAGSAARAPVAGEDSAPGEFVALERIAPGIRQEMRYAGPDNFTGERVDGYDEAVCLLTGDAARALRRAHRALADEGLGLLVYDCYRPQRAVDHFLRWANEEDGGQDGGEDTGSGERRDAEYHPRVPRDRLFDEGYLAARSGHSRGSTVDLTLVRESGEPVDMGTGFDFFDPASHTASREVEPAARAARERLRAALTAEGFEPVPTEWWHFTYGPEPFPGEYFDFPVKRGALAGDG